MGKYLIYKNLGRLKNRILGEFPKLSYSRSGEDLLLDDIFRHKSAGLYVDVGAFHPVDYSNTFKFYLKGWRGINIDANREVMDLFRTMRSKDINMNLAVGPVPGMQDYYMNEFDPSMNTVSKAFAKETSTQFGFDITQTRSIRTERLEKIISDSGIDKTAIDFLSVDVEGYDLEVLQSNDWQQIRPQIVLVEMHGGLDKINGTDIYKFLTAVNYSLLSYIYLNDEFGNGVFIANERR